jgi:thioredoxin-like negative regulator of GroEL
MSEQQIQTNTPNTSRRSDPNAAHSVAGPQRRQDDVTHWRRVALAASDQGENTHALRCWQHVLRLQPDARDAEFHIACCQALAGDREHAAETFSILAADPALDADLRRRAVRLARLLGYGAL